MTPIGFGMVLAAALGGGIGAAARLMTVGWASRLFGFSFPWGTLIVNVVGSLLMGLITGWLLARIEASSFLRVFLTTGVLGGFTTFSAYSLDFALLWEDHRHLAALLYASGSVVLSFAAVFIGLTLARLIFNS